MIVELRDNAKTFITTIVATSILCVLTYGYSCVSLSPNHDSLYSFFSMTSSQNDYLWQVSLGRVFEPFFAALTATSASTPLTILALSIFMLSIASYLVCLIFGVSKKIWVVAVCAVMCVNKTLISLFTTYTPWAAADVFALLAAVVAVYMFTWFLRTGRFSAAIASVVSLALSLGIYQSYLCVFLVLVILSLIFRTIEANEVKLPFMEGVKAALVCLASGLIYIIGLKVIPVIFGTELATGQYNGVTNLTANSESLLSRALHCLYKVICSYFHPGVVLSAWPSKIVVALNLVLLILLIVLLVKAFKAKGLHRGSIVFVVAMSLLLLPMANLIRMLNSSVHDLMTYAVWLFLLYPVLLMNYLEKLDTKLLRKAFRLVLPVCILLLTYNGVQASNIIQVEQEIQFDATQSVMTEILAEVDASEAYEEGVTEVAFVGSVSKVLNPLPNTGGNLSITGFGGNSSITYYKTINVFVSEFMMRKTKVASETETAELAENAEVINMPSWPSEGSIEKIDGVIVVKLGES